MPCQRIVVDGATGYVCVRGRRAPKSCASCGAPSGYTCDGLIAGRLCDAPICERCRLRAGPNKDLCPLCAKRKPPPQLGLPGVR